MIHINIFCNDTLSAGLTYNNDAAVYIVNGSTKTSVTDKFTVSYQGTSLTVTCDDVKAIDGVTKDSKIIVEYTAKLNENAVIGNSGNPNEVYLEFSNKPDASGTGDTDNTGKTPVDKVVVFTYELDTVKIDGEDASKNYRTQSLLSRDQATICTFRLALTER